MKPDILERLLMDRALKRLDPDTEVLLADYLANESGRSNTGPRVAGDGSPRHRGNA